MGARLAPSSSPYPTVSTLGTHHEGINRRRDNVIIIVHFTHLHFYIVILQPVKEQNHVRGALTHMDSVIIPLFAVGEVNDAIDGFYLRFGA